MNPSTAQATVLVDELVRGGVTHVVVCPGSRNAPLSIALHRAATEHRLTLHVRIDERSAAFLALGLARGGTGLVAITCTSGTAVANFHPAVLEAHHSGVPLLLLTADRPAELLGTGANQTIDQFGLFGPAATAVQLPLAEARPGVNALWRATACRALAALTGGVRPGPVQLNVPLRDPLVPDADPSWPGPLDGRPDGAPWVRHSGSAAEAPGGTGRGPLLPGRTAVLLGDCPAGRAGTVAAVAARAGWPVIAEPTVAGPALRAGAPLVTAGSLLINSGELPPELVPDAVVVAGRPTLTRGVGKLMRAAATVHLVDDAPGWTDPTHLATSISPTLDLAAAAAADPAWLAGWQRADRAAGTAVTELLGTLPDNDGLRVARALTGALPAGGWLFLGSSNPIRLADLVGVPRPDLTVLANRGVAGIDGSVSTAAGYALATGRPGCALLGDLTFLHDTNGLLLGPAEPRPALTVVVLNDEGGGIFSLLEQGAAEHADSFERVFGTPHRVDLAALCAAHHIPHTRLSSAGALAEAVADPPADLRVLELRGTRTDLRPTHTRLHTAVAAALR